VKRLLILPIFGVLCAWRPATAQDASSDPSPSAWSVHFQATSIGQHHGSFPSPYEGANSLPPHDENFVSLTATVFLAYRVNSWTEVVINPEDSGGKGFGGVTGIAGFTNGEIPRVAQATPTFYAARYYVRNTWGFGPETETVESGQNQIAGLVRARRFTLINGKFALPDFFDQNAYSHDPRTQFMNWALMENGAWDYPANTRGYTVAAMQELDMRTWSLRAATAMEPTEANGPKLDWRLSKNRGEVVEWEQRYGLNKRLGALRTLGYWNREEGGSFRQALLQPGVPDLGPTRRNGAAKYGFGLNLQQEIASDIGVFGRYGWSDGKTEAWAFTQIDRSLSGGVSIQGRRWKRAKDTVGLAAVRNYLSGDQRSFLAAGGLGFIIGDGRLAYRPETVVEAYYSCQVVKDWALTLDYQRIDNPAYNRDRGPVNAASLRVHWQR